MVIGDVFTTYKNGGTGRYSIGKLTGQMDLLEKTTAKTDSFVEVTS